MKVFRNISLILITLVYVSCSDTSEEQLIGDWQRRTVYPYSGLAHPATFVIGNTGYVVGGFNNVNPPETRVVSFNPDGSGSWNDRLRDHHPDMAPRQQAVGFALTTGGKTYGFVGTGWIWTRIERESRDDAATSNDFWRYDPAKEGSDDAWEEVAPLPGPPRRGAFVFSLTVDNKEYGFVGGGFTDRHGFDFNLEPDDDADAPQNYFSTDRRNEYLNDLWRYNPEGTTSVKRVVDGTIEEKNLPGSWEPVANIPFNKRFGAVAFVIGNKAYICNGENPNLVNDFYVFNPNRESLEPLRDPNGASLTDADGRPRIWWQLRTMNKVHPDDSYDEEYRPLGRSLGVSFVADVPERNNRPTGHVVGGRQATASTNWEYDEDEDLWTQRTRYINNSWAQNRAGMISFSFPSGRAFVGLGHSGTQYFDEMWEFSPRIEDDIYSDMQ